MLFLEHTEDLKANKGFSRCQKQRGNSVRVESEINRVWPSGGKKPQLVYGLEALAGIGMNQGVGPRLQVLE